MAGIIISSILTNIALYVSLDSFGGLFINHLEGEILDSTFSADMREIDRIGQDRLAHIMYADVLEVFRTIGHHFPILISSCLISICSIVVSLFFNQGIALFLLLSVTTGICVSMVSRKMIYKASSETNLKLKDFHSIVQDFSESIQTAKANQYRAYYKTKFKERLDDFIRKSKKEDKKIYLFSGIEKNFNIVMEIILSLLFAIPKAENSLIDYIFYVFLFSIVMNQGSIMEQMIQQILRSRVCFDNVCAITSKSDTEKLKPEIPFSAIEMSNLSFRYPNKDYCVSDLNLNLEKGDSIFLKGKNGSGKSTLLKLIAGMYSPDCGTIKIDGIEEQTISKSLLSDKILFICQDECLLNGTVFSYLQNCSRREISNDEIREVLNFVGFHDYDTKITNNGKSLSGGQQKKLLFAKLLINMDVCPVILVDELHAGMDNETKTKLNYELNRIALSNSRILVVTSHEEIDQVHFSRTIECN